MTTRTAPPCSIAPLCDARAAAASAVTPPARRANDAVSAGVNRTVGTCWWLLMCAVEHGLTASETSR